MSLLQHFYHLHNGDPNIYRLDYDELVDGQFSGTATASFTVNSNGTITTNGNSLNFITYPYNWKTPTTGASSYYVRFTEISGVGTYTGVFGTWLALTSNRGVAAIASFSGDLSSEVTFDVEIAKNADGTQIIARSEFPMRVNAEYLGS